VITYRVTLDVPLQLVIKVSNLLRKRRKELGTRNGTRALTCYQQAVFTLAWFRDRPGLSRLGQGFGISQATAYRYKDEGVEVLRALAPTLHDTLENRRPPARPPRGPPLPEKGPDPHRLRLRRRWRRSPRAREKTPQRRTRHQHENRNMLLRGARYQGERAFALMSQRWRAIRHVSADPSQIGDIAKSVLVLTQFEHKMIS
jgi:hypothetical protein